MVNWGGLAEWRWATFTSITFFLHQKLPFFVSFNSSAVNVDCGSPGTPVSGSLTLPSGSTLLGSTAQWSCSPGFAAPGETMYALCQEDRSWSRSPPVCLRKYATGDSFFYSRCWSLQAVMIKRLYSIPSSLSLSLFLSLSLSLSLSVCLDLSLSLFHSRSSWITFS